MSLSLVERTGSVVDAIDLFCGYGGSSQGIHKTGAEVRVAANHSELAIQCHAANFPNTEHLRADLSNPHAADYIDPQDLPPARFVWASPSCKHHSQANARKLYRKGPGSVNEDEFDHVAYANSERSRVTMLCPLRYAAKHRPEIVVVENVVEAAKWGPDRDGTTFKWWLREWTKLGYEYECLFLNSMFFPPCPQSRDRMYVVFWRNGNTKPNTDFRPTALCTSDSCAGTIVKAMQTWKEPTKAWPLERWGKYRTQYTYNCPDCGAQVEPAAWPAYTAIDWNDLGPTIGERAELGMKPLAPKTMERIRRGLAKFGDSPPFIIPTKATWGVDRSVFDQLTTQDTQQNKALAVRGISLPVGGNDHERPGQIRARDLTDQAFTVMATQNFGFAHIPFITEMRGGGSVKAGQHPIVDPAHTVTAGGFHHGLASPALFAKFNGEPDDTAWHHMGEQLNTITGRDSTGLVVLPWVEQYRDDPEALTEVFARAMGTIRDAIENAPQVPVEFVTDEDLQNVRFRMLSPDPELRRAMAFDDSYILIGNKSEQTSGLGNAVTPPVATWITERCLATLGADIDEAAA